MLRKRLIFTLLYDAGSFVLSRNFRLQRVGNLEWLRRNYDFSRIAFFIDELVVLDVTRGARDPSMFCDVLKSIAEECFVPIAAGGGVRQVDDAWRLLRSGADKIVVNTPLFDHPALIDELAEAFGRQCVVGAVDMKRDRDGAFQVCIESGARLLDKAPEAALAWLSTQKIGELYLNSIDRDGTGQGFDFSLLDNLPNDYPIPVILAGGVGNDAHLFAGMVDTRVDAVATAHLFNFVGDGLQRARESLVRQGCQLAAWPTPDKIDLATFKHSGAA